MKQLIVATLLSIIVQTVYGQENLSLKDAIQLALKNRLSIQRTMIDESIAAQSVEESKRKLYLDINLEATLQYNPIIPTSIIPIGQFNTNNPTNETRPIQFGQPWSNSVGIGAKLPLYDAAVNSEIREKQAEKIAMELMTRAEKEEIIYDVTSAYYRLVLARWQLAVSYTDTLRASSSFKVSEDRLKSNQIGVLEKKKAEYNLITARNNAFRLERNVENLESELMFRLGIPGDTKIIPTTSLDSLITTLETDVNETISPDNQIEHRKLLVQNKIYRQKVNSAKANLLPKVSLNGFVGANQFNESLELANRDSWYGNSFVNINATIPLGAFYRERNGIEKARAKVKQGELELRENELQLSERSRSLQLQLAMAQYERKNCIASKELAQDVYTDASNRFSEGRALESEVNSSYYELRKSEFTLAESTYRVLLIALDLQKLQGFPGIIEHNPSTAQNENN